MIKTEPKKTGSRYVIFGITDDEYHFLTRVIDHVLSNKLEYDALKKIIIGNKATNVDFWDAIIKTPNFKIAIAEVCADHHIFDKAGYDKIFDEILNYLQNPEKAKYVMIYTIGTINQKEGRENTIAKQRQVQADGVKKQ